MPSSEFPEQVTLARRAYFSAGRVLRRADWGDEKNGAVFGKRARPHGHDYSLTVFYTGAPGEEDGMIVNLSDIKPILSSAIAPLDSAFLNDLDAFRENPPSAENLVNFLWSRLPQRIAGGVLTRLCLQEAPDFWVVKFPDTMRVTKKYEFAAAHRLHAPTLSAAENSARYGKCNNPSGHGHNYGLEVTVEGTPDAESGVLLSPELFDKIVDEEVFDRFDHKHLNEDCPEFENLIPTSENLARVIFDLLQKRIAELNQPDLKLVRVGLNETQKNYFEVEA